MFISCRKLGISSLAPIRKHKHASFASSTGAGYSPENICTFLQVPMPLTHSDVFTIGDRHFRWEFPKGEAGRGGASV